MHHPPRQTPATAPGLLPYLALHLLNVILLLTATLLNPTARSNR